MANNLNPSYNLLKSSNYTWAQYGLLLISWFTPKRLILIFLLFQPLLEYSYSDELNIARHIIWRITILYLFLYTFYDSILSGNSVYLPRLIKNPLSIYFITIVISTTLALVLSYMELFQVIYALTTIALLLLFIKVIPYWFNSFDSIFRVINVYVFATIIIDLFGILEFVLNRLILNDIFFRMSSVFKDPNIYARFNLIAIFFLLSILFFQKNLTKNHKVYYSSALILTIVCVFLSLSRSGYLTFVLGLIVFSFLFKGKQYKIIVIGIVSLFTIIGVLLLATQRDFFGGTAVVETSGINRIQLILGGIRIIKDNWLLGIGYSNFGNFYITTYVSKILKTTEFTYYMMGYATSIHNWLIEVWVEQGIIGLLAFIFLFSNILKYLFSTFKKESDPLKRVCLSSFYLMTCVFLIHGFFYHTFIFHFFFWLMFSFAVSLITLLTK